MAMTAEDIQTLVIQGLPTILPPRKLSAAEVDGLACGLAQLLAATMLGAMGASDDDIDCCQLHKSLAAAGILAMQDELKAWKRRN